MSTKRPMTDLTFSDHLAAFKSLAEDFAEHGNLDASLVLKLLRQPDYRQLIATATEGYQRLLVGDITQAVAEAADQHRVVHMRRQMQTVVRMCEHAQSATKAWTTIDKKETDQ